jgi:saccharopine dehydrogenase-like NADP-dependent oxidoreductase
MARSALRWAEGDRAEADAAWIKAEEYLGRMPAAGTYAFDRDALAQLRKTLSTESVTEELTAV